MKERQFVIFRLGEEVYGIDIQHVREIMEYREPIKVPNTVHHLKGILDLRDHITPIVSLNRLFNSEECNVTDKTRIILSNTESKFGFIVDDAFEITTLYENEIEETPEILVSNNVRYLEGIGRKDNDMILIVNINELIKL